MSKVDKVLNWSLIILVAAAIGTAIILSTCSIDPGSEPSEETGIRLEITNLVSKSILPPISSEVTQFQVTGTNNGNSFDEPFTGSTHLIEDIAGGTWTVNVYAKNAAGDVLGSGSDTCLVVPGAIAELSIVVYETSGDGSLAVTW